LSELSKELLSRTPVNWGCAIATLRGSLSDEDRVTLDASLDRIAADTGRGRSKVYSSAWLEKVLNNHGHSISRSTIERHIKGKCSCDKSQR
jgi:hypothetical protein